MDFRYLKHLASLGSTNIHPAGKKATDILINELKISDSQRILEIGCGTGETMIRIASYYNVNIYGLDILPEMIKKSVSRIKFTALKDRIHISKISDDFKIPFEDKYFDRVYCESVICFQPLTTVKKIITEVHRVLKDNGIFAANEAVWKNNTPAELIDDVNLNAERDFGLRPASEEHLYLEDWKKIFNDSCLEVLKCDNIGSFKDSITKPFKYNILLSNIFTLFSKLKIIINPVLLKDFIFYKKIMKTHRKDMPILDAIIFVLKKNVE